MSHSPIEAIAAVANLASPATQAIRPPTAGSFSSLMSGVESVNQNVQKAEALATAFATDDSIPVHQVTYALSQARSSVELMLQVRSRLVEGYQELLRMQL